MKERRKVLKAEVHVDRNRSVFAKALVSKHGGKDEFIVSVPDREQVGFYLRHLKGLTMEDAIALHKVLGEVLEQYGES